MNSGAVGVLVVFSVIQELITVKLHLTFPDRRHWIRMYMCVFMHVQLLPVLVSLWGGAGVVVGG